MSVPPGLAWVRSNGGQKVKGAVEGGSEEGGMYVGRIQHGSGDLLPGKIHLSHGTCYVPYGKFIMI